MSLSFRVSIVILLVLAISGCATGSCQKSTGCTDCSGEYVPPAETVQPVAAPAAPAPVEEPVAEDVPAPVRQYVSK